MSMRAEPTAGLMDSALVVNADDLGVSKGATLGIVKAHREGIVTSASLAATYPAYGHALECVRACPNLGIGLHFTLTSGKPVSDAKQVPSLIDENGFFRWRFTSLLQAVSIRKKSGLLDQIEIELEAQYALLLSDGIQPDHVDSERHVHLIPGIFEKVAGIARRRGVKFVRAGKDIGVKCMTTADVPGLAMKGGFAKLALLSILSRKDRPHIPSGVFYAENVASYIYSGRIDLMMKDFFALTPPRGVTEIMVHPGIPEESRGLDLANRGVERYLTSEDRRRELNACIEAKPWSTKWKLTNFRKLAEAAAGNVAEPGRA
jgi:predicted glycoside hydrolase/deacetylase ChbG (UPF0249 family)